MSLTLPAASPVRAAWVSPARAARATTPKQEELPDESKRAGGSPLVGCFLVIFAIAGVIGFIESRKRDQALEDISAGDKLYAAGKKTEAVGKYKAAFSHAPTDRKVEIIKRSADTEAEAGNKTEARYWVEQGIAANVDIPYTSPAARDVLATIRREHAEAEAQRIAAEAKKKADQAAKKAEQEAKERHGNYTDAANFVRDSIRANPIYALARFPAIVRADAIQQADGSWAVFGTFTMRDVSGATIPFCYRAKVRRKADGTWETTGGDIVVELDS